VFLSPESSVTESSKPGANRRANGGVHSEASTVTLASEAAAVGEEPLAVGEEPVAVGGASEPTKQAFVSLEQAPGQKASVREVFKKVSLDVT